MKIIIYRERLENTPGKNYRLAWRWLYSYAVDGGEPTTYDTSLGSTISYLRRKFNGAAIEKAWI